MCRMYSLKSTLTALILLIFIVNPVYGIKASISTGKTTLSQDLSLDSSADFAGHASIIENHIVQSSETAGEGDNKIKVSIEGSRYLVSSILESSGSLSSSSSAFASDKSGMLSQSTGISGEKGLVAVSANSEENNIYIYGGFEGKGGTLDIDLTSSSSMRAGIKGTTSIAGVDCLDDNSLNNVASGNLGMAVEGIYTESEYIKSQGELGSFDFYFMNMEKGQNRISGQVQDPKNDKFEDDRGHNFNQRHNKNDGSLLNQIPEYSDDGGNLNSYKLAGWRWNTQNPQIKMYLRDDAYLRGEGLIAGEVKDEITNAANSWDEATNQNLFKDINTVEISTSKAADRYDGSNVAAFKPFSGNSINALAYSRNYFTYTKVGGYYSAKESDISFNTLYDGWSTTGGGYDTESIALHELGHTIGLADIYNDPLLQDPRQVMSFYTGVKRILGNGDKTGAFVLYG